MAPLAANSRSYLPPAANLETTFLRKFLAGVAKSAEPDARVAEWTCPVPKIIAMPQAASRRNLRFGNAGFLMLHSLQVIAARFAGRGLRHVSEAYLSRTPG